MIKQFLLKIVAILLLASTSAIAAPNKGSITTLSQKERAFLSFLEQERATGRSVEAILQECVAKEYVSLRDLTLLEKVVNQAKNDERSVLANKRILWILGSVALTGIIIWGGHKLAASLFHQEPFEPDHELRVTVENGNPEDDQNALNALNQALNQARQENRARQDIFTLLNEVEAAMPQNRRLRLSYIIGDPLDKTENRGFRVTRNYDRAVQVQPDRAPEPEWIELS